MYFPRQGVKLLAFLVSCVLIQCKVAAQNFDYYTQIKQVNESGASPVEASMTYSLDSPVNILTGAVCFDIPIYTIKIGGYKIPVSMHYETSGFKVATIASNVGMGWNLNAGGCITRTIKGIRDDSFVGYQSQEQVIDSLQEYIVGLTQINNIDTLITPWDTSLFSTLLQITDGLYDAEPDIYSFSFAGYSGNFIYDLDNNIHLIPEQNFNIERTNGNGFVITVDNGDKYYFGENTTSKEIVNYVFNCPLFWKVKEFQKDLANNFYDRRFLFNGFVSGFNLSEADSNYPTTWFLTKIELAQSGKRVLFQYDMDTVKTYLGTDETFLIGNYSTELERPILCTAFDSVVHRINRYRFSSVPRLRIIEWDNGKIEFVPSASYREDLNYDYRAGDVYGGRSINKIVISAMEDGQGDPESYSVDLNLSYFSDMNAVPGWTSGYPEKCLPYFKRLRLDSIVFNDINGNALFKYGFSYNRKEESHCYSRNTSQVDYWGYFKPRGPNCFNTHIERFAIIPQLFYYENGKEDPLYNSVYSVWERSGDTHPTYIFEGNSDMTPDLVGSKEFTIKEVVLPTGGKVRFEYELNDFFFDNKDISGPGVRVKEVEFSGRGYSTSYSYKDGNHSSGRVSSIPEIGVCNFAPDCYGWLGNINNEELRTSYRTARQFSTVTDMKTTCESLVQYGRVAERCLKYGESMGETVYHHQLNLTAADSVLWVGDEAFIKKTKCKWSYLYEYPEWIGLYNANHHNDFYQAEHIDNTPAFTPPIHSWYNGFLTKKEKYDENNRLVESIEYKYSLRPSNDSVFYIQSKYLCKYSTVWQIPEFAAGPPQNIYNYEFPMYYYDILWGVNYYKTGVRHLDTIVHKHYCEGNDNLANVTTKIFGYNSNNYVNEIRTENSDGCVIRQTYNYPVEYAAPYPNSVYTEMVARNMLNSIVEQYTSVDNKVTDGSSCRFEVIGTNNEFIKPKKLFKLHTNSLLTDFQPFGQDGHYELANEMKYDPSSGNLVEIWDEREGNTAYVWGFHNSLLLAKIQNATDSEVRNALGCTMEALQEKTDTDELIGVFQALRNNLPSAMVTSYTYDLFQNLISITDPSGKTNRFEYDDALRLKLTRDVDNNILMKHEYHYHYQ